MVRSPPRTPNARDEPAEHYFAHYTRYRPFNVPDAGPSEVRRAQQDQNQKPEAEPPRQQQRVPILPIQIAVMAAREANPTPKEAPNRTNYGSFHPEPGKDNSKPDRDHRGPLHAAPRGIDAHCQLHGKRAVPPSVTETAPPTYCMRKSIRPLNSVCISIHAPIDPCLVPCLNPPDAEHDAGPSPMRYVLLLTEVAQEKTLPFAPLVPSAARCAGGRRALPG